MSLDWPPDLERTPATERRRTSKSFKVSVFEAIDDLENELALLDVDDWRLSTTLDHRKDRPNVPYKNQDHHPDDPGAVVRWSMNGDQYAIGADQWDRLRDNVREIGLYIREKRKMEGRPVTTGQSEFATARLPAADEEAIVADEPPHEVLGLAPDAPDSLVKAAFRGLVKQYHPDTGDEPDSEQFQRIKEARRKMLE